MNLFEFRQPLFYETPYAAPSICVYDITAERGFALTEGAATEDIAKDEEDDIF